MEFWTHIFTLSILIILTLLSKVGLFRIWKILKGIRLFVLMVILLNLFFTNSENALRWWIMTLSWQGFYNGLFFALRLFLMIWAASLFGWVTRPIEMSDALEKSFSFLSRFKIPVRDFCTILLIGMRFIPLIFEDAHNIKLAQKARGLKPGKGIVSKIRSLIPLVIPLFINSFRRADAIAVALEIKGYSSTAPKTFFHVKKIDIVDYLVIVFFISINIIAIFFL